MKHFSSEDLSAMDRFYRLNLINSITGYKSANLIGTQDPNGKTNLAIFNSVIHLGSEPPLIGFVLRPLTVPRHTYENLKATGVFTINHIRHSQIADAHHTAAKYPKAISEFDQTKLQPHNRKGFNAPFVSDAPVQIACKYVNEYLIKENGTVMIVGGIEALFISDSMLLEDGWIQLDKEDVVAINGLDGYALPKLTARFPYARPKK